jgi:hypothetical protein
MTSGSHPPNDDKRSSGVTIGTVIGGIHGSIVAGRDVIVHIFTGSTEQQRAQRNRQTMLRLVKDFWVKGVLEQSLHGEVLIELGLEERADAVEHPWDIVVQTPSHLSRQLPRGTKIVNVFDEMYGAFLILGEPGSGKTTMLLELARDTVARAEADPTQRIPVVLNLSTWAGKRCPIEEWLVDEFGTKYNIPKRVSYQWIENDDLVLLFDGLDEVKVEHREACVKAINDFRQEHGLMPLVVCSRIGDYETLTTRLKLNGAVLLQPLTLQQIEEYLDIAGTELVAVRQALQYDTTFRELARSPLMLSVMTLAYRGLSFDGPAPSEAIPKRRKRLFDVYVERMFEHRRRNGHYTQDRTIHWLEWLAQRIREHDQTIFYIERMQPEWISEDSQQELYKVIVGLSIGVTDGVILALPILAYGSSVGLATEFLIGLVLGLAIMVFCSVLASVPASHTYLNAACLTVGIAVGRFLSLVVISFFWVSAVTSTTYYALQGLSRSKAMWGVVIGLILALVGSVTAYAKTLKADVKQREDVIRIKIVEELGPPRLRLLVEIILKGFERGLGYNFMYTSEPVGVQVKRTYRPNEGIWRSLRTSILFGLVFLVIATGIAAIISPIVAILMGLEPFCLMTVASGASLISRPLGFAVVGLSGGLLVGRSLGGLAVIMHTILRLILWCKGNIAWNYDHFLDYAVERIFLRKVGGGYMFVHRLLMEYFASLEGGQAD